MKKLVCILFISFLLCIRPAALLCTGCNCGEVKELQRRLHAAGYYDGPYDGFYSGEVAEAVARYQRGAGVFPDGICTYRIARSLGVNVKYDENDELTVRVGRFLCAVCRGDDYLSKLALSSLIVNRIKSPLFPDDVVSVISGLGGAPDCAIPADCLRAAYEALCGAKPYGDILYYSLSSEPDARLSGREAAVHGRFVFYR